MADISRIEEEFAKWESQQYAGNSKEKRTKLAQFFTPAAFAKALVDKLGPLEGKDILDPCLGSGNLIAAAVLSGADPKRCYGIELDDAVLEVAKKRLAELGVPEGNIISGSALEQSSYAKKFDCIVMNPPYQRNLHLKILAEAIKHLKDEKSVCVNLSPVRWLQDPLAKYKKTSDLKRFEESVAKHIESLDIMSAQTAQNLFSIVLGADLGVYACRIKKHEIKDYSIWPFKAAVLEYIISHNPVYEQDKADGWRVRMPVMTGASGRAHGCGDRPEILSSFGKLLAFKDGKTEDGKWWYDCYRKNQNFKPTPTITRSIKFDSKTEAAHFIKQFDTSFGKFVTDILTGYVGIGPECCLWLADAINPRIGKKGYTGEWTDDDLYKFFSITPEEQKVIEETMEKYKKKSSE